ncbi:MAG: M81 family metallopeptidase [Caulobacteraceae bacterium]
MRIFVAALITETNTFSPWPTAARAFELNRVFHGDAGTSGSSAETALLARVWRERARRDGHEVVESLMAFAQPAGPTVHATYVAYRDEILADLAAKGPVDVVLLFLHGAMVSTECDDCEGDLIGRIREIVGPKTAVGAVMDLHLHLTQAMVEGADVLITVKEYPHIDFVERAEELYDLCLKTALGEIRPTAAVFDCRMVGFYPTTTEPMRGLTDMLFEAEKRPGVLSVSFAHGFPWGDTPDTGSRVLAIADNDPDLARSVAEKIGLEIYAAREALLPRFASIDEALSLAGRSNGLSVLADTADNAGGGAPSDNVSLLEAMLAKGVTDAAYGAIWDPVSAEICADAGVGARLALRLGGKYGPSSGKPIDVTVTVRGIAEKHVQRGLAGSKTRMGLSAWVEVGGVDVVICSIRTQVFSPDAFTGLGIDLAAKRLIVVKSSWHFQAGFSPMTEQLVPVATPGAIEMDFAAIDYRKKRDLAFFPRVADPLGRDTQ